MKKPGFPEELKIRVESGLRTDLAQIAASEHTSVSEIIRRALRQALAQQRLARRVVS